jgi:flagellar protein FlaG
MLTVAGIVAILAVVNALMPAISRTTGSIIASADSADGRISTQIEIIHATGSAGSPSVDAWAKNVGAIEITALTRVDVFFGPESGFTRLPQGTSRCTAPCWYYSIENDSAWNPTATMHITINWDSNLSAGTTYFLKVVTPNGVSDARFFSV